MCFQVLLKRLKNNGNILPQNTYSFSSIAQSIVKKLEGKRDTSQWKQIYQAYIYAINKYQTPYFGYFTLDNLKDRYEGYFAKEIGRTPAQKHTQQSPCCSQNNTR